MMRYQKSDTPIDRIRRQFGVDHVPEGSARREAGRICIAAELIRAQEQAQLWADSFGLDMAGILALQSDVARQAAGALALELLPTSPSQGGRRCLCRTGRRRVFKLRRSKVDGRHGRDDQAAVDTSPHDLFKDQLFR